MADQNPYNRKTQPTEWQNWINEQVAKHEEAEKESGNKFQQEKLPPARSPEEIRKDLEDNS